MLIEPRSATEATQSRIIEPGRSGASAIGK